MSAGRLDSVRPRCGGIRSDGAAARRDQQAAREALQAEAHCDALPDEMLPVMVEIQRLRDAAARAAGSTRWTRPAARWCVITGNGHARLDWGAPAAIWRAPRPISLSQRWGRARTRFGAPDGGCRPVEIAPDVDRGDPCAAFREG